VAVFEHKGLGIRFEISEEITFGQLEKYELAVQRVIKDADGAITDMVLARAALAAAYDSGILDDVQGLPEKKKDMLDQPAKKMWWAAQQISSFIMQVKEIPPN